MYQEEVPPSAEWIVLSKVAKDSGVTAASVHSARKRGLKSRSGCWVLLPSWKTLGGWVTTQRHLDAFNKSLNT